MVNVGSTSRVSNVRRRQRRGKSILWATAALLVVVLTVLIFIRYNSPPFTDRERDRLEAIAVGIDAAMVEILFRLDADDLALQKLQVHRREY